MAEKETQEPRDDLTGPAADPEHVGGQPTMGGSAPGGAPTGLRHESGITSGGLSGTLKGGALPTGAGGGTGTGAGGLATGMGGIGGTRNLPHGAGRPSYGPAGGAPLAEAGADPLETLDTAETTTGLGGANKGEAGTRTGSGGVEPESSPDSTVRGAGSGRT